MDSEIVTLTAGGQNWTAFERLSITAALNETARCFKCEIALQPGAAATAFAFKAGTPIVVAISGNVVFTGHVDDFAPFYDVHKTGASIAARSGADIMDCAAIHDTNELTDVTLLDVAKQLDKFGVGFSSDEELNTIPVVRIIPGEKVFDVLDRLAVQEQLSMSGQANGTIKIGTFSDGLGRHAGGLLQGDRFVKSARMGNKMAHRHSHVHVRGQQVDNHGQDALEIEAVAEDKTVPRYRPTIVNCDCDIDKPRSIRRARTRRDRAAGRGLTLSLEVRGWRDKGGQLWTPGYFIYNEHEILQLAQDMMLEQVTFNLDAKTGIDASLCLVDPRAYAGKKGRGNKSGDIFDMDSSDASDTTNTSTIDNTGGKYD